MRSAHPRATPSPKAIRDLTLAGRGLGLAATAVMLAATVVVAIAAPI